MNADRPLLGILLMVGFAIIAPGMDALGQAGLGDDPGGTDSGVPVRGAVAVAFAGRCDDRGAGVAQSAGIWRLHFARAALILIATGAFFTAISVMPIADAIAIFFVEPFLLTLFGAAVSGRDHRLAAHSGLRHRLCRRAAGDPAQFFGFRRGCAAAAGDGGLFRALHDPDARHGAAAASRRVAGLDGAGRVGADPALPGFRRGARVSAASIRSCRRGGSGCSCWALVSPPACRT